MTAPTHTAGFATLASGGVGAATVSSVALAPTLVNEVFVSQTTTVGDTYKVVGNGGSILISSGVSAALITEAPALASVQT